MANSKDVPRLTLVKPGRVPPEPKPVERARIRLIVPYREKDEAKAYDALWDPVDKTWFTFDMNPRLGRWLPLPEAAIEREEVWAYVSTFIVTAWKQMLAKHCPDIAFIPGRQEERQLYAVIEALVLSGGYESEDAPRVLNAFVEHWADWAAGIQERKGLPFVPDRPSISFVLAHVDIWIGDVQAYQQQRAADKADADTARTGRDDPT